MFDKEKFLKSVSSSEDRLLASKLADKVNKSVNSGVETHTDFMDPRQRALAERIFSGMEKVSFRFDGGYDGAERTVAVLSPDNMSYDSQSCGDAYIKVVEVVNTGTVELSHRDYLGSVLGLGIKREKIGDILLNGKTARVFVSEEISQYLCNNLFKVGRAPVSTRLVPMEELEVPEKKIKEIKATVASLRLDCITGAGYGISRTTAAELIKAQKLNLNWKLENSSSKQVKEGDTISLKGKGRIVLEKIVGTTRKDRISVIIQKYI